jgi:hypothetical protein
MDIYRMHVTLRDIEPPIWRRIELPARNHPETVSSNTANHHGLGRLPAQCLSRKNAPCGIAFTNSASSETYFGLTC